MAMILRLAVGVFALSVVGVGAAAAQATCAAAVVREVTKSDAHGAVTQRSRAEIRSLVSGFIQALEAEPNKPTAGRDACLIAELLKRLGDRGAEEYYRRATATDSTNAELRLLFGDYLRNFRGPLEPLVAQAASEYYEGLKYASPDLTSQIRRRLIALYERDGLVLGGPIAKRRPMLFASVQAEGAHAPYDFGTVDTVRTLTTQLLLAQSRDLFGRQLSPDAARALIRNTWRGQTMERLRLRTGPVALDGAFHSTSSGLTGHQLLRSKRVQQRGIATWRSQCPVDGTRFVGI